MPFGSSPLSLAIFARQIYYRGLAAFLLLTARASWIFSLSLVFGRQIYLMGVAASFLATARGESLVTGILR